MTEFTYTDPQGRTITTWKKSPPSWLRTNYVLVLSCVSLVLSILAVLL